MNEIITLCEYKPAPPVIGEIPVTIRLTFAEKLDAPVAKPLPSTLT